MTSEDSQDSSLKVTQSYLESLLERTQIDFTDQWISLLKTRVVTAEAVDALDRTSVSQNLIDWINSFRGHLVECGNAIMLNGDKTQILKNSNQGSSNSVDNLIFCLPQEAVLARIHNHPQERSNGKDWRFPFFSSRDLASLIRVFNNQDNNGLQFEHLAEVVVFERGTLIAIRTLEAEAIIKNMVESELQKVSDQQSSPRSHVLSKIRWRITKECDDMRTMVVEKDDTTLFARSTWLMNAAIAKKYGLKLLFIAKNGQKIKVLV